jgi:hypothetical protein
VEWDLVHFVNYTANFVSSFVREWAAVILFVASRGMLLCDLVLILALHSWTLCFSFTQVLSLDTFQWWSPFSFFLWTHFLHMEFCYFYWVCDDYPLKLMCKNVMSDNIVIQRGAWHNCSLACRYMGPLSGVFGLCLFLAASFADPGVINASTITRHHNTYPYDNVLYIEKICTTCKIPR